MKRNSILLVCPILAAPAFAADSSVLREIMGETVYQQSGIRKLSERQIKVLEEWVLDNLAHEGGVRQPSDESVRARPAPDPASEDAAHAERSRNAEDAEGRPAQEYARAPGADRDGDVIRSRIDGPFKGWRNNGTRFRLENGQIWEQRQSGTFVTDLESPEVIIRRNRFGYTMEIPRIGRKVHVKRAQ